MLNFLLAAGVLVLITVAFVKIYKLVSDLSQQLQESSLENLRYAYLLDTERLAHLEHEQWMSWAKAVADEVSEERRKRWQQYWVPYSELPEDIKDLDRVWAKKVLEF
jgi:hypothetical protein